MSGPRILVTNDDGIDAPGLAVMREIAAALSDDVWIVAPDGNQSGAGHRFTLGRELRLDERDPRTFVVVGGSPADCVVAGYTHVLADHPPDIVLSGVNAGQNLGDIVNCSGTAAGAREGALQGALGIALSQGIDYPNQGALSWDVARAYGAEVVRQLYQSAAGRDVYYNVNFPHYPPAEVAGIRVVGHQRFSRSPFRYFQSENDGHFFVAIPETPGPLDADLDFQVLRQGKSITVTPLSLLQTDTDTVARLDGRLTLTIPR